MRTSAQITTDVFYTENGNVYLVENNYDRTLPKIDRVLAYAKTIGLTIPDRKEIRVEVLRGARYKRMLSIEFNSKTKPTTGHLLTQDSGLWEWLVY